METRAIFVLLGLLAATAAVSAEVWRWVDDEGVVHFSDTPRAGAERIDVSESNKSTGTRFYRDTAPGGSDDPVVEADQAFKYETLSISSPGAEETLWNIEGTLSVTLSLSPGLQTGHQVRVYFNGEATLVNSTSFTLDEVHRGVHNIQAEVLDATGRLMIRSTSNRFYVQQNRVR